MGTKVWGILCILVLSSLAHANDESPIINDGDGAPIINDGSPDRGPIINDDRLASEITRNLHALGPILIKWNLDGVQYFSLAEKDVGAIRRAIRPWNPQDQNEFLTHLEFVLRERRVFFDSMFFYMGYPYVGADLEELSEHNAESLALIRQLLGQLKDPSQGFCGVQFDQPLQLEDL